MKAGTYAVTVSGFLTEEEAEDYAQAARDSDSKLESEVIIPTVKSFNVQEAEFDGRVVPGAGQGQREATLDHP